MRSQQAALALAAVILVGSTLGAQQGKTSTLIAGVADADTGQPLEGAEIVLFDAQRMRRANALGEAVFDRVPRGSQHVRVRRIGYAPAEIDVATQGDTTGAVFRLQRSVVSLSTVRVEAEWAPMRMKDVDVRRRQAIGRFLTEADLDRDRDRDFPLVLATRLPGLKTLLDSAGNRVLARARDLVGLAGIAPCYTTVYLDDVRLPRGDLELVRTWDLAVVESYSAEQVPVRYRVGGAGCGVVLLWSKWY